MNDPHYYTGSDDRDLSYYRCEECGWELLVAERAFGICGRCEERIMDADQDEYHPEDAD